MEFNLVVNLESWADGEVRPRRALRLDAIVEGRKLKEWKVDGSEDASPISANQKNGDGAKVTLLRNFEFRLPLSRLLATPASSTSAGNAGPVLIPSTSRLRLRFSLWQNELPVDALPMEGWIELQLLSEAELTSGM